MSRTRILLAAPMAAALALSAQAAAAAPGDCRPSDEPGLPGVTIYTDLNNNGQFAKARRGLNDALAKFQSERPPSPFPEVTIDLTSSIAERRLRRAMQKFEAALGPNRPQVRACRAREAACLRRCRAILRRERIKGRCACIAVRANCLKRIRIKQDPIRFGDGKRGRVPPSGR